MIIINLVSITLHSYNIFLVMKTFKIFSLRNFQIHSKVLSNIFNNNNHAVCYITSTYLSYNWEVLPSTTFPNFTSPHSPASGSYQSFCFWVSTYKWDHTVFISLWLILLTMIPSRLLHVFANETFWYAFYCISMYSVQNS